MLQTQVNYWTLQETKRHNFATENLQSQANALVKEQNQIGWFTAKEASRHNKEQEAIGWTNANENIRHNQVSESLGFATLAETKRHNVQQEGIGWANVAETRRHNVQQEGIGWTNAAANLTTANANRMKAIADVGRYSLEVAKLPSEIMKNASAAKQSSASASYYTEKAGAVKHEVIQGYGNMIGNLLGGAGKFMSGKNSKKPKKVIRILD